MLLLLSTNEHLSVVPWLRLLHLEQFQRHNLQYALFRPALRTIMLEFQIDYPGFSLLFAEKHRNHELAEDHIIDAKK